jgi:predicted DNA-binding protein
MTPTSSVVWPVRLDQKLIEHLDRLAGQLCRTRAEILRGLIECSTIESLPRKWWEVKIEKSSNSLR